MRKKCGFQRIVGASDDVQIPVRKTARSAGYDIAASEDTVVKSHLYTIISLLFKTYGSKEFKDIFNSILTGDLKKRIASKDKEAMQIFLEMIIAEVLLKKNISYSDLVKLVKENSLKLGLVPTGLKAYMEEDQRLDLYIRSSVPLNSFLLLGNSIGLIDADYYGNQDNDGHIFFQILNLSPFDVKIKKGDIIGQGVFSTYDITEDDSADGERIGGFGSTNGGKN